MNAATTALTLPDGSVMEVPLPGSKGRFVVKSGTLLAATGGARFPFLLIGVVVGVVVGATATVWYLNRK